MAFNEFYYGKFNPKKEKKHLNLRTIRYCWFECDVTAAMLVSDQGQKHFSPLGTKLYFHVNSSRKYSDYCIDIKHGRLVTWLQAKNIVYLFRGENHNLPIVNISFFLFIDS